MAFIVYKHTCPNGKVYIGITSRKPSRRWRDGEGYNHNPYFFNAILKYGWDNIKHEILFEGLSKENACKKEMELIEAYQSTLPQYGYNLSIGGESGRIGTHQSVETRRKISEGNKGNKQSPIAREKISAAMKGKRCSEEHKEKLREAAKHSPNWYFNDRSKPVLQYDKSGRFIKRYKSIKEAEEMLRCRHICDCCQGKQKTAAGYIWRYEV